MCWRRNASCSASPRPCASRSTDGSRPASAPRIWRSPIIAELGIGGGTGSVIEYAGEAIRALDMEGRMTVCNMSIETGARAGMIAPDEVTVDWLRGRPHAPQGEAFDETAARWLALTVRPGRAFRSRSAHRRVADARRWRPGARTPDTGVPLAPLVPSTTHWGRAARAYMGLEAGQAAGRRAVDVVFIGSCTNGRLPDLRAAADVLRGRRVRAACGCWWCRAPKRVRREAEAEGLHEVFLAAGAEWRLPGCSMCIAMNGDQVAPGKLAVSTSNRNFEGRQGPGARTVLAGPAAAAASAVAGRIADPRPYLEANHG